ncbi:MAG TPA: sialidase family protein, partial [Verrucomicrobiae bacterium]|nr:sialidase family protein [Verrucomicrobiae bacterium]
MDRAFHASRAARLVGAVAGTLALVAGPTVAVAATPTYTVSPITNVSTCAGQNAEVEQASDPLLGNVYATWMGCKGIAFARSTDGGLHFGPPIALPGASGSNVNAWDPTVTVAPDGTVYAAFMVAKSSQWYPVV